MHFLTVNPQVIFVRSTKRTLVCVVHWNVVWKLCVCWKFLKEIENEHGKMLQLILQLIYFKVCSCIYRICSDNVGEICIWDSITVNRSSLYSECAEIWIWDSVTINSITVNSSSLYSDD
jgi:hypothetical protein